MTKKLEFSIPPRMAEEFELDAWEERSDDPSKVYRGGRRPEWLKALKEEGREPIKVA